MAQRTVLVRRPSTNFFRLVGFNTGVVSSNALSISVVATGAEAGDLVLAWIAVANPVAPNGANLDFVNVIVGSTQLGVYASFLAGNPGSVSWSPIPTNNGAVGGIIVFRNTSSNPIGAIGETTGSTASPDPPDIIMENDGGAVVCIAGTNGLQGGPIAPTNYTLCGNDTSNFTNDASGFAAYRISG